MRRRQLLFACFVIAIATLGSAALAEAVLRITGLGHPSRMTVLNGELLKGKPGAKYVARKENVNKVQFNGWGFHDRARSNDGGAYRILFLGDSMVEAEQVPSDATFTALVEKKLAARGKPVEAINAGVSGAGTAYEYQLWHKFFRGRIRVDHVMVVLFTGNDLENNSASIRLPVENFAVYLDGNGEVHVAKTQYSLPRRILKAAADRSAVVNTTVETLYLWRENAQRKERQLPSRSAPASAWQESIQGTLKLLDRWNGELRTEGIAFSIAVIDFSRSGYLASERAAEERDAAKAQHIADFIRQLEALAGREGIPLRRLEFTGEPGGYRFSAGGSYGHLNFEGHRMAAAQIADWLEPEFTQRARTAATPKQ
jgi:lysophospholipase L1-like esterase